MDEPREPSTTITQLPNARSEVDKPVTPARTSSEKHAFTLLALVALAALVRLAQPVGVGLFLGALVAFALEPVNRWLRERKVNAGPAALACALGAAAVVMALGLAMATLLLARGVALLGVLRGHLAPGGGLRSLAEHSLARLTALHINVPDIAQKLESETVSLGSRAAEVAEQVAALKLSGLLTLFFMTLGAYFVLRRWSSIVELSERLLPFERRHTRALLGQFRKVGREVLLGTVVTGVVQGLLAGAGYWLTSVPEPAFFGALTAMASLIPGVGTLLVWVSIGVTQVLSGHVGQGLVELVYSALTVGVACDYLIRPRLVGSEPGVPSIFTFIALFGGVEVFGVIGLILGPVTMTLSLAILRIYEQEVAERPTT
jgi:predicted PurR-regulated permease PerM